MGKDSKISWTDHTFNPWWGCVKVSPGCTNCYAETFSTRTGNLVWGKDSPRRFFGDKHWNQPKIWNRVSAHAGRRARVFCASMADVFEDRKELEDWRERLWGLILETPNLDWLLLTKRPENVRGMVRSGKWPLNVWLGVTAEDQKRAEERLPILLDIPAHIRWISAEPLLGPLNLRHWISGIHWVIVGGESGTAARLMEPGWALDILAQCRSADVAYHFKQKGNVLARRLGCKDRTGKDSGEWPTEFKMQEFPVFA